MTEIPYLLFYLGVLVLVVGCLAYLFTTREGRGRTSRRRIREAEKLSGTYRISALGNLLDRVAFLEAWGVVVELEFTTITGGVQMIINQEEVELYEPSLEPKDIERFRRSVEEVGLKIRPAVLEGQYCVGVKGTWPAITDTVKEILRSLHGVGDEEKVHVRVFG